MSITYSYAYADESGDTGYDLHHGGSTHFVLGIVLPADPEATIDRIVTLRRSLNKATTYEFHFQYADMVTSAVASQVNGQAAPWFRLLEDKLTPLWHERFEDSEDDEKRNSPD